MMNSLLGKTFLSNTASTTNTTEGRAAEPYLPEPYRWCPVVAICLLVPVAKDHFESENYDECQKKEAVRVVTHAT